MNPNYLKQTGMYRVTYHDGFSGPDQVVLSIAEDGRWFSLDARLSDENVNDRLYYDNGAGIQFWNSIATANWVCPTSDETRAAAVEKREPVVTEGVMIGADYSSTEQHDISQMFGTDAFSTFTIGNIGKDVQSFDAITGFFPDGPQLHDVPHNTDDPTMKDTNPKDPIGASKWRNFSTIPMPVIWALGVAMREGSIKYGRHNYRVAGVRSSVYFDAAMGHLTAWWEGENIDPDSGLNHVIKAVASLAVLYDAIVNDMLNDDRPPSIGVPFQRESLQRIVDAMAKRYPNPVPPYTDDTLLAQHKARAESIGDKPKNLGPIVVTERQFSLEREQKKWVNILKLCYERWVKAERVSGVTFEDWRLRTENQIVGLNTQEEIEVFFRMSVNKRLRWIESVVTNNFSIQAYEPTDFTTFAMFTGFKIEPIFIHSEWVEWFKNLDDDDKHAWNRRCIMLMMNGRLPE